MYDIYQEGLDQWRPLEGEQQSVCSRNITGCETAAHCFSTYEIIMEKIGRGKNGAGGKKKQQRGQ